MASKTLIISIHGIGNNDTENGKSVQLISQKLSKDQKYKCVSSAYSNKVDNKAPFREYRVHTQTLAPTSQENNSAKVTELYWADLSPTSNGYLDLLRQIFELALGARHISQHAIESAKINASTFLKLKLRFQSALINAIYTIIYGPIIALNAFLITAIFITTIYFSIHSIPSMQKKWALSHYCPWQLSIEPSSLKESSTRSHQSNQAFICRENFGARAEYVDKNDAEYRNYQSDKIWGAWTRLHSWTSKPSKL